MLIFNNFFKASAITIIIIIYNIAEIRKVEIIKTHTHTNNYGVSVTSDELGVALPSVTTAIFSPGARVLEASKTMSKLVLRLTKS